MKNKLPLIILTLFSTLMTIHGQTDTSYNIKKLPLISVKGNSFVNPYGDTILFRGVSISDPDKIDKDGYWEKAHFNKIKEMGVMIVRIPVHPVFWRERGPEDYLKLLDQAVRWCTELEMYAIIDWHSIGNLKMELFQNPEYITTLSETNNFWLRISQHFAGNNTVAFYEYFNEPTLFFGKLGRMSWEEWKKINEDLIALTRSYDKETIPLIAPMDWAYDLTPLLISPIEAEGIAYVTHPYAHKRKQPWEPRWDENFGFAASTWPVFATEFGFRRNIEDYGNRIINYLEDKGISWACWVYDPLWGPPLLKSYDYELTESGEFIKRAMHGEVQKKIK